MLGSMRNGRGLPTRSSRLLLYLLAAAVLGPVVAAIFLGGGFQILGYPL